MGALDVVKKPLKSDRISFCLIVNEDNFSIITLRVALIIRFALLAMTNGDFIIFRDCLKFYLKGNTIDEQF